MPTLTWVSRDDDLQRAAAAPYRLLEAVPELGAGDAASGNMLIQGDNLDALKALLPYYAGRVKCIYIDPPYNTRSAFEHYDDNLQHAEWLAMIYPRLELLRELLSEDGSIWVSIDDNEGHYLKVVMDEVFGRQNFVTNVVWQKKYTVANDARLFSDNHDHVVIFAKNLEEWSLNRLPRSAEMDARYRDTGHPKGRWKSTPLYAKSGSDKNKGFSYTFKNGVVWTTPVGAFPRFSTGTFAALDEAGEIYFPPKGGEPARMTFLAELKSAGAVPATVWLHTDAGHNHEARDEVKAIVPSDVFGTPKPERLLSRIIHIATNPGDLVLDSFLGSGTTAAVAHKMGRRYIGIEMGDHAVTHCAPRLRKVIDGEQGGISASVGWQGGGGFAFYRLGEPVFDEAGRINPAIRFAHLAAHVWFSETGTPLASEATGPWLGTAEGRGLALLYNGILGDKSVSGGNVLTLALLKGLRSDGGGWTGPITIYGEASRIGPDRLKAEGVTFKQTPYDVRAR